MLAVTTRNKLRGSRFFWPMARARQRIKSQLYRVPGIVRFITGIASPTEFYTLTIWESQAAMFNFTASESHRQMMWMFTRWAESFWSMRWQLTADEVGAWDSLTLADRVDVSEARAQLHGPGWLARSQMAETLAPYFDITGRLDRRAFDPTTSAGAAVLARVLTPSPLAVYRLKRELRSWQATPGLLRLAVGIDPGQCLLITVWLASALEESRSLMQRLPERFPGTWAMRFTPGDYEIGHWDNLRLRQLRKNHSEEGASRSRVIAAAAAD